MEGAPETRATYDAEQKCASWEVGDQVNIDGSIYDAQSSGTTTTFKSTNPSSNEIRPAFVSSSSRGFSNDEMPSKLVDEAGVGTKWCANTSHQSSGSGVWDIIVSTGHAAKLQAIKLWNGNDTKDNSGRRWKNVRVYGASSANGTYNEIKTFENLNLASDNKELAGTLEVNATQEYSFYKIEVSSVESGDIMQMSDMKFVIAQPIIENHKAYFPATLYNGVTATLPDVITETWAQGKFNMPMYASSTDNNLMFKNLCGVLKITVKSDQLASVKSITVSSANKAISGTFTVDNDFAAQLSQPNEADRNVTVNYTEAVSTTAAGTEFFIAIPAQTYQDLLIEISDGTYAKWMKTKSGTNIAVERNKIYPITFANNVYDENLLPGLFSVSPTKKVRFTKGNLFWDARFKVFEFGPTQIDKGLTVDLGDKIWYDLDLVYHFYWANKSDFDSDDENLKPYAFYYNHGSRSVTDQIWCSEENKISVEGTDGLYVLSGGPNGEWDYLINKRENASNLVKFPVRVATQDCCLIIAPDGYGKPIADSYSLGNWPDAEAEGLVCLPPASYRAWDTISADYVYALSGGFYWGRNTAYNEYYSYVLKFSTQGGIETVIDHERRFACCIRLVK